MNFFLNTYVQIKISSILIAIEYLIFLISNSNKSWLNKNGNFAYEKKKFNLWIS